MEFIENILFYEIFWKSMRESLNLADIFRNEMIPDVSHERGL